MELSLMNTDERLAQYQLFFDVALTDDAVKPIYANYGYDEGTMQEGVALFDSGYGLQQDQKKEYGEQYAATDELDVARNAAYAQYVELVQLARIALKRERNFQNQLELDGKREQSYNKLYMQMLNFYDAALGSADIQTALARFRITVDTLNAGRALVMTMQQTYQAQKKETSEAQRAVHDRDTALDALDDWMGDFIGVSRIALSKEPEYLERLGLVDPS